MNCEEHEKEFMNLSRLKFAVLTLSDTRTEENDESGKTILEMIGGKGHEINYYCIIKDELAEVRNELKKLLTDNKIQIIITNGSTGIGSRDIAVEAIKPLLDKELQGFGEIFRALSYQEIGSASMLSRAFAGLANKKLVFCLPGSRKAVKLGLEKLILPQAKHLVWVLGK